MNIRSLTRAGPTRSREPRVVRRRQAVAERARNRHAEARRGVQTRRSQASAIDAAAAGRDALDLRDGRRAHALEPIDHRVDAPLVADAVVPRREACELADVGARRRTPCRPRRGARTRARVGSASTRSQASTSASYIVPGHGVAGFGAVEGEERDRAVDCRTARERWTREGLHETKHERRAGAALEGIRVLDVTQVMAGPFCAMQLCDMGADVIKVEPPEGDSTRRMAGAIGERQPELQRRQSRQAGHRARPRRRARGQDAFRRLARRADIIIENYRPGVMRRFGLDYAALAADQPGADLRVDLRLRPDRARSASKGGFDLVAQGVSGLMSITGEPGGPPVKVGVPLTDLGAGAVRVVGDPRGAASTARAPGAGSTSTRRSSRRAWRCRSGRRPSISPAAACPQPMGSAHRMSAPYQAIRCADGYITLAAANDRLFRRLCELLGSARSGRAIPTSPTIPRASGTSRTLAAAIESVTRARAAAALARAASTPHGIPCGPINDYAQVFADPQVARARHGRWTSITRRSAASARWVRRSRCRRRRRSSDAARRCSASIPGSAARGRVQRE